MPRLASRPCWFWMVLAFILSRCAVFLAGVRMDPAPLGFLWQVIDPVLLRARLMESLYHLHSQPPLFNFALGLFLKAFGDHVGAALSLAYLSMGLVLMFSIFYLLRRLGAQERTAALLALAFLLSPSCILYENFLFYTYPLAVLLCLTALWVHRFLERGGFLDAATLFMMLGLMALSRSLFHLVWFLGMAALLFSFRPDAWKRISAAAAIPLALIVALYLKNYTEFGVFGASSWLGMNVCKMTTVKLPEEDRARLFEAGKISSLSFIPPFSPLEHYPAFAASSPQTGIPLLDEPRKSNGEPNLHHMAYLAISRQYLSDALAAFRAHPTAYAHGLLAAYSIYFRPASDYVYLQGNRDRIRIYDRFCDLAFRGRLLTHTDAADRHNCPLSHYFKKFFCMGLTYVIVYPLLIVYAAKRTRRAVHAWRKRGGGSSEAGCLAFILANLLYVTIVGNALEVGENNRFRFMIDPLFWVLLGLAFDRFVQRASPPEGSAKVHAAPCSESSGQL